MKYFYISNFKNFNDNIGNEFKIDERNIHEFILIDYSKGVYYYYSHHNMFSGDFKMKDNYFKIKGSMIDEIKNKYPIKEEIFNQILELKHSFIRGYFKNNFLKLFNLEEFII